MTKSPDLTGNPSRRTFTKSIATALATLPLMSSSVSTRELWPANLTSLRPELVALPPNMAINHMPPLIIRSGSLEIETAMELFNNGTCASGLCKFTQKKTTESCGYGTINSIYINDDRGKSIYSEEKMAVEKWEIKLLLQKQIGTNDDGSPAFDTDVTKMLPVIIRPSTEAEGSFEIVIKKDLGKASDNTKLKLNHYRKLFHYKISELDKKEFRIGQVIVTNGDTVTKYPTGAGLGKPEDGYEIYVVFNDVPGCIERVFRKEHKGFWEYFRKLFRRR